MKLLFHTAERLFCGYVDRRPVDRPGRFAVSSTGTHPRERRGVGCAVCQARRAQASTVIVRCLWYNVAIRPHQEEAVDGAECLGEAGRFQKASIRVRALRTLGNRTASQPGAGWCPAWPAVHPLRIAADVQAGWPTHEASPSTSCAKRASLAPSVRAETISGPLTPQPLHAGSIAWFSPPYRARSTANPYVGDRGGRTGAGVIHWNAVCQRPDHDQHRRNRRHA